MSYLRILISTSFLMMCAMTAIAETPAPTPPGNANPAKFAEHKQKELARIAHHLQVIQTLQSCVQSATDHASLKACHETARSAMKNQN